MCSPDIFFLYKKKIFFLYKKKTCQFVAQEGISDQKITKIRQIGLILRQIDYFGYETEESGRGINKNRRES
jgi:hypothetical protein